MDNFTPARAADTTRDHPWSVAWAVSAFCQAVAKWPSLWVEGQIEQIDGKRSGVYITLKDLEQNVSMQVTAFYGAADQCRSAGLVQGDKILVYGRPNFYQVQCRFSLMAQGVLKEEGEGSLLKVIEALKQKLAKEGLFDASHKIPIPAFPRRIGLVCGAGARAEGDIVTNSRLRWPDLEFTVEHAAVQGVNCPPEVSSAIRKLDEMGLDVIIVARGGGSFEDLIGFSNEQVVRAAAECRTPIVSAIGHEGDWTLIDLAADKRCSTPTDVAGTIIPSFAQEAQRLDRARTLLLRCMELIEGAEEGRIARLASAPFMQDPAKLVEGPEKTVREAERSMFIALAMRLDDELRRVSSLSASLKSLSPISTLSRGYALVEKEGFILSDARGLKKGDQIRIVMRDGALKLRIEEIEVKE
ncbi:MAG: exodeoxyribonuclease VII large subunit [Aeriscardovia sp.]|nr:exodeoxyribonuclease VII large subunit [Aeriscardovia sp.]